MQRDLVIIAVLFLFINTGHGKICPSIEIKNKPSELEQLRNCTIIMGYLRIVLLDSVKEESAFDNHTFPELTEIVDHLMLYRIPHLTSLNRLFPNLRIIRGRRVFRDYSLVIFKLNHLEEVGLKNLQHIEGGIMIGGCKQLCYANTVDWNALGAFAFHFQELPTCKSELCPKNCVGRCWNKDTCQKPSTGFCEFFEDEGKCVKSCPRHKVHNYDIMKCMTRKECETMLNGTWWVFNDTCVETCPIYNNRDKNAKGGCVYAGKKYKKECRGGLIEKLDVLQEMKDCTHINTSLELRITQDYLVPYLEKYLGNVVSISGYLNVSRSGNIKSLEFFKNLELIKGEELANNVYALYVFQNKNLEKLWDFDDNFNLTIRHGSIQIHDNRFLCPSDIIRLEEIVGAKTDNDTIIFRYSNGYNSVCNQKNMTVKILENNPTNVTLAWQRADSTTDNEVTIGYTIYYVPVLEGNNITAFENKDECSVDGSYGIFVRENKVQLVSLRPFTRYGYYFKIYTTNPQEAKTPVYYFVTASTEPPPPIDFDAEAVSDTSVVLSWKPPSLFNGRFSHYELTTFVEEDYVPLIQQRNYCYFPHVEIEKPKVPIVPKVPKLAEDLTNTTNCTCSKKPFAQFFTEDVTCTNGGRIDSCIRSISHQPPSYFSGKRDIDNETQVKLFSSNATSYEFKNLRHYTLYVFYLRACNVREDTGELLCGSLVMVTERTRKRKSADAIKSVRVATEEKNARVRWSKPEESNSILVAYQVEYKRTDSEYSKPKSECLTEGLFNTLGQEYNLLGLNPAKYAIRVQAISLAGPGTFSEWRYFEIVAEPSSAYKIYTPIIVISVIVCLLGGGYYWYRKRYFKIERNHLITSINPDYVGPIYVEDDWEIDRNDIEIIRELGKGSFGTVYEGLIKSRQYPCAIKTISEKSSISSKMEFLNEGSVMKSFSETHHVIKLLGIVSRGDRPFVIMELMERGDLKSYLRRCRGPSQNLTTNEIYRMASEIADGMAYLSVKKFVHRDLAARNCMVAADRTVKIGDFGMARDIYETDYYRKGTAGLLPIRWMAPESLADGVFTTDSDVWSYGVVLWEMATLAELPYQGLGAEEVLQFVTSGRTLDMPPQCSDLLHKIMSACWKWRPNDRPTFFSIVDELVNHVGEDFRLVAFCFSRQGTELRLNAVPRVYNPPAMMGTTMTGDEGFSHYDRSEEEVNLYMNKSNRPTKFLPFSNQRMNKSSPYQLSPGSPSSTSSFNSS
ncbi:insulin-like receptor isoform X1 [Tribolium castaneum]|nr:PREDICTED: insulin-like receptor isoform X2 [Tribolium castaneum]EFA02828.2 insulin-like growth factor receptor [Tribolium castaneum]|eukprot:XP_975373.2 PREDICTED: insulin-like receptor isoform X2 [Tribolium castaneum]